MSEKFKPWLVSPEVQANQENLSEALSAEQLAFEYKAKTEEMLAYTDRVRKYITYEDILASDFFQKLHEDDPFRKTLIRHSEQSAVADEKGHADHGVLFGDLNEIMNKDERVFEDLLFKGVRDTEIKKVREMTDEKTVPANLMDEAEDVAIGKSTDILYSFDRYLDLKEQLAAASPEDMAKINAFRKVNRGSAKEVVKEIDTIKSGIEQAKISKNISVIGKASTIGERYKTGEERAVRRRDRLEKLIERQTGRKVELGVEERYEEFGNIVAKDFLPAYVNYHGEMARLHNLLQEGKIVETKYVEGLINEAMPILTKNPPTIVYFNGDFGSGKTALAVHISRTRFKDAEGNPQKPIIISGSKFLEPDRLTEEFRLGKLSEVELLNKMAGDLGLEQVHDKSMPLDEIYSRLIGGKAALREKLTANALEEQRKKNASGTAQLPPQVLSDIEEQVDDAFSNTVQGRYVLGAMYEAMKEGRPLIIDEANAISPDVLIAFNDLLTKKIGDPIPTRSDPKGFKIKKGYCVMWTGNTGKRYENIAGRKDLDPAAYSRIAPIKVEYLPQSREINSINTDELLGRLNLDKMQEKAFTGNEEILEYAKKIRGAAQADQIFQVLVLKLMNDRMGAELLTKKDDRYSVFKDLYRLSMGARLIMDLFEEKTEGLQNLGVGNLKTLINAGTYKEVSGKLRKANLSMRELIDNIVGGYLDQGGSMDIEYYLFKFIKKYDQYPEEQAILMTTLRKCGFFEPGAADGWPDYQNAPDLKKFSEELAKDPLEMASLTKYKRVQINGDYVSMVDTHGKYAKEYFTSLETMQLILGYLPPTKKESYEKVEGAIREQNKKSEMPNTYGELLGRVKDITESLFSGVFDKRSELIALMDLLKPVADKIMDKEFIAKASDEDFIAEVGHFCDTIIAFLREKGKISAEEHASTRGMSTADKTQFLKKTLGDLKKGK